VTTTSPTLAAPSAPRCALADSFVAVADALAHDAAARRKAATALLGCGNPRALLEVAARRHEELHAACEAATHAPAPPVYAMLALAILGSVTRRELGVERAEELAAGLRVTADDVRRAEARRQAEEGASHG
jgi:hypothetical protein